MDGALGAYVSTANTIVINQDWLATASSNDANAVLVEEFAHFLETQLKGTLDTPGDEGEAFSKALLKIAVTGDYPNDTDGTVAVVLPDGTSAMGEANHSIPVASSSIKPNHLSIDGGGGFDSISLPDFDLYQAADFARTGGFGEFVNFTSRPEGEAIDSAYLNMSIENVEKVTWDKTSQETAAVSDVTLMGVQDTRVSSGADLAAVYGVDAKSAASTTSVGDGVSSYSAGLSLGAEDSDFTAGDALSITITFGGKSTADAQSVADDANAVAVGYGVGLDNTDLTAGSILDVVIKDASQVEAGAFTTAGDVFGVASNDGIGATDLVAVGDSAVDVAFTLNLTNSATAITTEGGAEAVGWLGASALDDSSFSSGGIGLINIAVTGLNAVRGESVNGPAIADAFSTMEGVNNTSFTFADTNSELAVNVASETKSSASSILGNAFSNLTSTVLGLFGQGAQNQITGVQSVDALVSGQGFAEAASVSGAAAAHSTQSVEALSGYNLSTTENLSLTGRSTLESSAVASVGES
jgi:hypothetical protein